ncbi:MAG: NAD(P)-dependent oxidoreductase [Candidatus Eremiobacteraeota bacterium]|nr:NAD(P)-dependent oxidoreductase [Candidatus Eremiobacteraeota bacterium]
MIAPRATPKKPPVRNFNRESLIKALICATQSLSQGGWRTQFNWQRSMKSGSTIGFVGLGTMGEHMARCILRAGYRINACAHKNRAALDRLIGDGVTESADPAAVAAASDAVVICVPDSPQVESVVFGPRGLAAGAARSIYIIDMSTISPVASRDFAQRLQSGGHHLVDAPVSGGPARAKDGTLTIMVGASDEDFAQVQPLLETMGTPTHLGVVGMGQTVKLVNQIMIANIMVANAEALMFAQKAGADVRAVRKVIATATGSNYLLENWLPKTWFARNFEGGFALDLLRKDLNAALEAARAMKMPMPASALAYQTYTAQSAKGDGARDYSAVAKFYESIAGDEVPRDVHEPR